MGIGISYRPKIFKKYRYISNNLGSLNYTKYVWLFDFPERKALQCEGEEKQ